MVGSLLEAGLGWGCGGREVSPPASSLGWGAPTAFPLFHPTSPINVFAEITPWS